jgi:hypothetical protein
MSTRQNPSDVDLTKIGGTPSQRRHSSQDCDIRRSRSTGTTPRSSTRKHRTSQQLNSKDVVDASTHRHDVLTHRQVAETHRQTVDKHSSTSSDDDDDDRCRIIPASADDDYLERLDRKVSEVINRSRLGNNANADRRSPNTNVERRTPNTNIERRTPNTNVERRSPTLNVELNRSNSEHYGPLSLSYNARTSTNSLAKSSPGSAHRISSKTPQTSSTSTAVNSNSSTSRPDNVRFVDNNNDEGGDSSDTVESSPEDFVDVIKSSNVERWSNVDDDIEDESAEGDDEGNDGVVLRRRR